MQALMKTQKMISFLFLNNYFILRVCNTHKNFSLNLAIF
nr:MAG TPA: hypothetical protein [Caudoviricetes sp.]